MAIEIKRFGLRSLTSFGGTLGLVYGLLVGLPFLLATQWVLSLFGMHPTGNVGAASIIVYLEFAAVSGIFGGLLAFILGLVYNFTSFIDRGITVAVEQTD